MYGGNMIEIIELERFHHLLNQEYNRNIGNANYFDFEDKEYAYFKGKAVAYEESATILGKMIKELVNENTSQIQRSL